jgi:hypothetical protein
MRRNLAILLFFACCENYLSGSLVKCGGYMLCITFSVFLLCFLVFSVSDIFCCDVVGHVTTHYDNM